MSCVPIRIKRSGGNQPTKSTAVLSQAEGPPVSKKAVHYHKERDEVTMDPIYENIDTLREGAAQKVNVGKGRPEGRAREVLGKLEDRPSYAEVTANVHMYKNPASDDSKRHWELGRQINAIKENVKLGEKDRAVDETKEDIPVYATVMPKNQRRKKRVHYQPRRLGAQGGHGEVRLSDLPWRTPLGASPRNVGLDAGYMARRPVIKDKDAGNKSPLAESLDNEASAQAEDSAGLTAVGKYLASRFPMLRPLPLDRSKVDVPANVAFPLFHDHDICEEVVVHGHVPAHHIDTKGAAEVDEAALPTPTVGSGQAPAPVQCDDPAVGPKQSSNNEENYFEDVILPMRQQFTPGLVYNRPRQSRLSKYFDRFKESFAMSIGAILLFLMFGSVVEMLFNVLETPYSDEEYYYKGPNGQHNTTPKNLSGNSAYAYVPITLFGDADFPTLSITLLSFAASVLVSGFYMERMLITRVMAAAGIFALLTFPFEIFAENSEQRYAGVLGGISAGLGLPACLVWITDKAEQNHRGTVLAHIISYLGIGMAVACQKVLCVIMMVLSALLLILYQSVSGEERVGATLGGIINQVRREFRFEPAVRRGPPFMFFRRMMNRLYRRPVIILSTLTVLLQLSGTSLMLFLATDYYKIFNCNIQWFQYSKIMTSVFFGLTSLHVVYMYFCGNRRLLLFMNQALYSHAVLFAFVLSFFSYSNEDMSCAPGVLLSLAGLVGITGCLFIPVWTCSELLPGRIRPQGTAIVLALAALTNVAVLYGYSAIFNAVHPAVPLATLLCCNTGASTIAYIFLPNMEIVRPNQLDLYFAFGWLFHRQGALPFP